MKLVIASDNYYPRADGISRFLSEIIPRLKEHYEITLICPAYKNTVSGWYDGITIVRIPLYKFHVGDFRPARFERKIIQEEVKKADIVFTQTIGPVGGLALLAAKKYRKRLVSFIHSVEWELVPMAMKSLFLRRLAYPFSKRLARSLYAKCDLILVPSESTMDLISWELKRKETRIVHLGCDTKRFIAPRNKQDAKEKLGIDPKAIVIGYHGRLSREKDLTTLMRAFLRLNRAYNKKLLIVGDGVPSIKRMFERRDVIMAGSQFDVVPFLQAMDIYVLPSLTETTCLSVLEAMSCEIPVVATRVGYVKEYIEDGKNGIFFDFEDSVQLAKRLEYLIEKPDIRARLAKAGRGTVVTRFDWDHTVKDIVEAFKILSYSQ